MTYSAGTQTQHNAAINSLIGAAAGEGDTIYANVLSGKAIVYGSAVDNGSGAPFYVPGVKTKADTHIEFGIDLNNDGKIDVADANGDGILDSPIDLYTIGYPNYFRVVVLSDGGQNAKIELADSNTAPNVSILDEQGTVAWAPFSDTRGTTLQLRLKITVNGVTDIVTIPGRVK